MGKKQPRYESELDKFHSWIDNLKNASETSIILVEGKNDKKALESFKIKNVYCLRGAIFQTVEFIASKNKECILLVDLDAEGRKLHARLLTDLQANGVKVNTRFRKLLFATKIRNIEAIPKYLERHLTLNPRKRPSWF